MEEIKQLIQLQKDNEDLIIEKILKLLETNKYLKKQIKTLNNYDEKQIRLSANDMQGVDFRVNFELEELKIDIEKGYLESAIEEYLDADVCGINYNSKDNEISISSSEEIWINSHKNIIIFPDKEETSFKLQDDFHTWLLAERWMEETGYFPSIFTQGYYDYATYWIPDEKYSEKFSNDSKTKLKQIEKYLDFYNLKECCNESQQTLDKIHDDAFKLISEEIKTKDIEEFISITEIKKITFDQLVLNIETKSALKDPLATLLEKCECSGSWHRYELTIHFTPNSLMWILGSDEHAGEKNEMSFLSVG